MHRRSSRNFLLNPVPAVLLLMLLIGAATGQWAGGKLRMQDEKRHMDLYMTALLAHANRLVESARETLDQANRSPYPMCSAAERTYLRGLLFSAYQIKDIGRLRDGKLQCSTLLTDLEEQAPRTKADVDTADGIYVYNDGALITPGSHGAVLGSQDSNVVLSSVAFDLLHTPNYEFGVYLTDAERMRFARLYSYPSDGVFQPLPGDSKQTFFVSGGNLREQLCDPVTHICITLQTRIDYTSLAARLKSFLSIIFGMLVGGSVGMGWLFYRSRDRSLISRLGKALAARELDVVYQPVVDIIDGRIVGFEALLRWEIEKGDFVPPDIFIAKAEEHGLAGRVTLYVLDAVVDEMGYLLQKKSELRININITASDVQDADFLNRLEERIAEANIRPQQIGLELTERTAVDFTKASAGIKRLRERGHRIYIDDFGTGYSSLAYLGELHVDAIKIDKAFTRTVGKDRGIVSVVPQIMSMAEEHGLDVVVEGVETEAQVSYFRDFDLPLTAQGWYFGKPMPATVAQGLIAVSNKTPPTAKRRKKTLKIEKRLSR